MNKKIGIKNAPTYSKEALLNSRTYRNRRDLLNAILDDGMCYTIKEVNDLLTKEQSRKVVK